MRAILLQGNNLRCLRPAFDFHVKLDREYRVLQPVFQRRGRDDDFLEEGWTTWLDKTGLDQAQISHSQQVDTSLMAFELAARGFGVALGRSSLASREISSGRLMRPFSMSVEVKEGFFLLWPAPQLEHPHAEIFRAWILNRSDRL